MSLALNRETGEVSLTVAIAGGLVAIAVCALLLALTLRVTHWIRERFSRSPEISWCFLVATWSTFGACVIGLAGVLAPAVI